MIDRRRTSLLHSPTRSSSRIKDLFIKSTITPLPGVRLSLVTQGKEENQRLSQERIEAAKTHIKVHYGTDPDRIPPLILRNVILCHRNSIVEKFTVDQYNRKQGLYHVYRRDIGHHLYMEFQDDLVLEDSIQTIQA